MREPKYIAILGGVISGLGKGIVTSSIGTLLKEQGYKVSAIKIDPYINIDAGTMRPTEHGEVWVTEDGAETDQDLGNYERFIGGNFSKENSITTGQVYLEVIQNERNLKYDGKCVEVIPHIPLEVIRRIRNVGKKNNSDFVLIEVGGTVGEYQNILFLEALRRMKRMKFDVAIVQVVYLPVPGNLGEMKTKPAQHAVRDLNSAGLVPDFIVARSKLAIDEVRREKLSVFCNVDREDVIAGPDMDSVYKVPLVFEKEGFGERLLKKFGMKYKKGKLEKWRNLVKRIDSVTKEVKIAIVGKYFDVGEYTLEDSYVSVIESIKHACWVNNVKPVIEWIDAKEFESKNCDITRLSKFDGVIVPGGFGASGTEGKISVIKYLRENNIPFLGICYGMQFAVVEFARKFGLDANTTEVNKNCRDPVVDILPSQKKNLEDNNFGATMRLGGYEAKLTSGSLVRKLYGRDIVSERHRHRYEVNPKYVSLLEEKGMVFSGRNKEGLVEFMELPSHPYFVGTQAHPEFKSTPFRPAPLFDGLIKAAINNDKSRR